jgi:hypothetical protein
MAMMDRSDAVVVTTKHNGHGYRRVFEPRSDGRYDVVEKTLTKAGDWREVGYEVVDEVAVETP